MLGPVTKIVHRSCCLPTSRPLILYYSNDYKHVSLICQSQWPRGVRRSAAARLLRLWVPIPKETWIFVCCEFCVWSGRGPGDGLITHPEESYRLWCVVVRDLETHV
jgi:hypothetical protein